MRGTVVTLVLVLTLAACGGAVTPASPSAPATPTTPTATLPPLPRPPAWRTDFDRLAEHVFEEDFIRALPRRDAIPPLDAPSFSTASGIDWIGAAEPVIAVELNGEWRAYPLQILVWHEIVNDRLGGRPVTVTFCPLCHTSVVFNREVGGSVLDFGVTGYLRRSDLVMYDRQTESWWQQATGVGLIGDYAGTHLEILASSIVAWSAFALAHPGAMVLDRRTGYDRPYGESPYPGWDIIERNPYLGAAQPGPCEGAAGCIDPKERVAVVTAGGETLVVPFRSIAAVGGFFQDEVGGIPVVVWWRPNVTTVMGNGLLEQGDQVGSIVAFDRRVDGELLDFRQDGYSLRDAATDSVWNELGTATDGPTTGSQLARLQVDTPYWIGYAAFSHVYRVWTADEAADG